MPIYTYHCVGCGADFEKLIRNGTSVACPECEGTRLERQMSLPAQPGSGGKPADFSSLGPPAGGGGCCGGSCHSHQH
jgi:putative FmdB family regulatory protein